MERDNLQQKSSDWRLHCLDYLGILHVGFTFLKKHTRDGSSRFLSATIGEYCQWGSMTLILWHELGGLPGTRWSLKCGDDHHSCCNNSTAFRKPGVRTSISYRDLCSRWRRPKGVSKRFWNRQVHAFSSRENRYSNINQWHCKNPCIEKTRQFLKGTGFWSNIKIPCLLRSHFKFQLL